ncbi:MAG: SDR family oxidoreductase [Candidatus Adiutrix sp.]|jgi:3-oxoacyl-[acyl-carrier protein] reductase|nr:SDR family oxidoreductase [Candidatus Adiutrix sp.]
MLLEGKTAVVTGCLQGIGRAILEVFAENGAEVFACCQHEDPSFSEAAEVLAARCGVAVRPVYFDLEDEAAITAGVRLIQQTRKNIDILVNVAGLALDALFHMMTREQLRKTFEINFFSQMLLTQYITRLMLRGGRGSVVNIASIAGLDGNVGQLAYGASKAALIAATKTLSLELGPLGIRVNAIAPGVIDTAMTARLPGKALARQMALSELKRTGTPREVAGLALFLASDEAGYLTGQVIRVDGGIG